MTWDLDISKTFFYNYLKKKMLPLFNNKFLHFKYWQGSLMSSKWECEKVNDMNLKIIQHSDVVETLLFIFLY